MCPAVCKERNFNMNSLHKKALFIRKWLLINSHYQNLSLSLNEAYDTALYFAEKLDVHSMKRIGQRWEFKIRVGKPKFRGSAGYTLLPHSLKFNSRDNGVTFSPELEEPKWYSNLVDTVVNPDSSIDVHYLKKAYTQGNYSNHPHIATDGKPCLGGWSSAWCQTIAVNNLASLIPVSQSFLNTWTSNDAYWNINNTYRAFMHMPAWARKEMSLGKFIAKTKILFQIAGHLSNGHHVGIYPFTHWVRTNEDMLLQLVNDGMEFDKILDCYYGNSFTREDRADTEDKEMVRIKHASQWISNVFNVASNSVSDVLLCSNDYATSLVAGTMIGIPEYYAKHPWSSTSSRVMPAYESANIREAMQHRLSAHQSPNRENAELHQILGFARKMNRREVYRNISYKTSNDVTDSMIYYLDNLRSDALFSCYLALINKTLELIGYPEEPLKWIESNRNKTAVDYKRKMLFINDWMDSNPESNRSISENVSKHIAFETLDNYEVIFTNQLIRRIKRGKRINKPALHNINTADNGEQNQIPIGTF